MHVVICGCGRVGSGLARDLVTQGFDVSIIDESPDAFHLLGDDFPGEFVVGRALDWAVLREAGIETAIAFVACTDGDNTNIVAARTAKDVYRVPLVVARIYDPRRAHIYRDLGIPTVASVTWTVGQIHQMLLHRRLAPKLTFGNGETVVVRAHLPEYLSGRPLLTFEVDAEIRVIEVTRGGHSVLPERSTVVEPGDLVTFAVAATALHRLESFLGKELS